MPPQEFDDAPALPALDHGPELWSPEPGSRAAALAPLQDIGEALLAKGAISKAQLDNARKVQAKTPGRPLAAILLDMGAEEDRVQETVAHQASLAFERARSDTVEAWKHIDRGRRRPREAGGRVAGHSLRELPDLRCGQGRAHRTFTSSRRKKRLRVRFRIDGVLFEAMNPPHSMHAAIVSRLKIMANLDIAERRLPAGRPHPRRGAWPQARPAPVHPADRRRARRPCCVSSTPGRSRCTSMSWACPDTLTIWQNQINQPHGIVLVTGPTGSGKSTTLYASLGQMDRNRLNISTVEDPVEYHLDGINQTQTHEKIGMTFASALRALLRQDPDVIMVGEIRDMETAGIAIQAALTGHLVLSTLHTNDAPSAVTG